MSADKFAKIIDADWFANHPKARITVRAMIPGEFGPDVHEQLTDPPYMVLVIRETVRVLVRPLLFDMEDDDR
ncbi:hypothetical protein [Nocardioides bizhenqiangii]|uniref:Uncharacterized protein n=1 Tax=Nocardioides bizhenqiangii TaxID=3095076 RepID=A0ABZ0ZTM6_9ACTN|nr:hypothetical protein [Nocardioides sp. HM61]WQQ27652.1 hypothetical protein SHK19_05305 [Nocardioides sp. HM61]